MEVALRSPQGLLLGRHQSASTHSATTVGTELVNTQSSNGTEHVNTVEQVGQNVSTHSATIGTELVNTQSNNWDRMCQYTAQL